MSQIYGENFYVLHPPADSSRRCYNPVDHRGLCPSELLSWVSADTGGIKVEKLELTLFLKEVVVAFVWLSV